jgi:hypothetical protein
MATVLSSTFTVAPTSGSPETASTTFPFNVCENEKTDVKENNRNKLFLRAE